MNTGTGRTIYRSAIAMFVAFHLVSCAGFPTRAVHARDTAIEEWSEPYSREELARMLAPVALYPDALLSQVLMASTYPVEIVEADRWLRQNPGLEGEALDEALLEKDWAPGVKAICHFPEVLAIMSERIGETAEIGDAFLNQETDVMNMVQELRAKAYAEGNLETTSKQRVIVEKETIVIKPADPMVVYVPYYDPYYVYGSWWYPAYPPYCWRPCRSFVGFGVSYWPAYRFNFAFGYWNRIDWHGRYIHMESRKRPKFVKHDRWTKGGRWRHSPRHGGGIVYRDKPRFDKHGRYPRDAGKARKVRRDIRVFPAHVYRDRDRRDGDRYRNNTEKHFRGNLGTPDIRDGRRAGPEPEKRDRGSYSDRYRRDNRMSGIRDARERQGGPLKGVRFERNGRTGIDRRSKSIGTVRQRELRGREPRRTDRRSVGIFQPDRKADLERRPPKRGRPRSH